MANIFTIVNRKIELFNLKLIILTFMAISDDLLGNRGAQRPPAVGQAVP
jgi:hypothetical protein